MEARNPRPMTYADFEKLPEDARVELIDGAFYALASGTTAHSRLTGGIYARLWHHLLGKKCEVLSELAVRFEESMSALSSPIPDICVVCEPEKIQKDAIHGAPTLVVEVLSPSTSSRDQTKKLRVYERYGVKEYWAVHQDQRAILQCVRIDGIFDMNLIDEGAIVSTSIEGFSIDLKELYASIPLEEPAPSD